MSKHTDATLPGYILQHALWSARHHRINTFNLMHRSP